MRTTTIQNGLTFTGYAGSTGVLLAWDLDELKRQDLLGFAIQRVDKPGAAPKPLGGGIVFPGQSNPPGVFPSTLIAPIQAFRWGDYALYPGHTYEYELIPVYAPFDNLRHGPSATISLTTENAQVGNHTVAFNRAVAASQAYARKFPKTDPHDSKGARGWLAKNLDDVILAFIKRATNSNFALDVLVYEYELELFRDALKAARDRGVQLRIVYHAQPDDDQTKVNETNLTADGWAPAAIRARVTDAICHDKVVVLSNVDATGRHPIAVLSGSTNWTFNGLYFQANVAHAVDDPVLAAQYLALFEQLFAGLSPGQTDDWIGANNKWKAADTASGALPLTTVLSPRPGTSDLRGYVDLIHGAKRSVLFATTFSLESTILAALAGEDAQPGAPKALRYGLQNSASRITGFSRESGGRFTATGKLRSAPKGFLKEEVHGQQGNILVHLKIIVLDFDTATPTIITGSANYSHASSASNDENALVIHAEPALADVYAGEFFRFFDHYRFRYNVSKPDPNMPAAEATIERRDKLDPTDAWTARYYADPTDVHAIERLQLSRPTG